MVSKVDARPMPLFVLVGSCLVFFACILILISFCSPNWVERDKRTLNEFVKIGLWEVCFDNYRHPKYQYDRIFTGCKWIFHRDMYIIRKYLEPGWFKAVQVFMTFAFLGILAAAGLTIAFILQCGFKRKALAYKVQSVLLAVTAGCMAIALITFAVRGDDRNWMQHPYMNHFSWSFALAVVGGFVVIGATAVFWLQARRTEEDEKQLLPYPSSDFSRQQQPPYYMGQPHQAPYYPGQPAQVQPHMQPPPQKAPSTISSAHDSTV